MPRVDVNGVSLYYEVSGHGPPLVLAHGFACGLRMWDPQVSALARSWRVVTYDVRVTDLRGFQPIRPPTPRRSPSPTCARCSSI